MDRAITEDVLEKRMGGCTAPHFVQNSNAVVVEVIIAAGISYLQSAMEKSLTRVESHIPKHMVCCFLSPPQAVVETQMSG